jgi:hypothetical protein
MPRLEELKLELPRPSTSGTNYVPFVRSGSLVFLTGQLSQWNGERRFEVAVEVEGTFEVR